MNHFRLLLLRLAMPQPTGRVLLLALLVSFSGRAQNFWRPTATAPFGPKNGLLAFGDSTLLTAVPAGLLRSTNQGRTWALARRTRPVHTLFATRRGLLLAGGAGVVYRSHDAGATWDSVAVATTFPVTAFTDTPTGDLLLGTGGYVQNQEAGDGVFFSADAGRTWTPRNLGFGTARYVAQLLADRQGRVFAATTDYDDPGRQPGLYVSANNGQQWQYLPVRFNDPQWPRAISVYHVTSLVISPQDSLLLSFEGALPPIAARGNYVKSLADITNPAVGWKPWIVGVPAPRWWDRAPVLPVYIARNGDRYSSREGLNQGGTLYAAAPGRHWVLHNTGLGTGSVGLRERQFFAEFPNGKLFMVQQTDSVVYYRPGPVLTAPPPQAAEIVQLAPNPTAGPLQIEGVAGQRVATIAVYDARGRHLRTVRPTAAPVRLDLTAEAPGLYLVAVQLADGRCVRRKVLKQ